MGNSSKEDTYAYYYHTNYIRNARAIAIAWALFTFCFAIIMCVVLVQPYWLGDGPDATGIGYFGLYRYCVSFNLAGQLVCQNALLDVSQATQVIPVTMFVATIFVAVAVAFLLLSILCMLLFLCKKPSTATVFKICGALQLATGLFLLIGILIYPASWSQLAAFVTICGPDVSYGNAGKCQLRWVFYLAIVAIFDAIVLGVLAFILASKQEKLATDMQFSDYYPASKGNFSNGKKKSSVSGYPTASGETGYPSTNRQNGTAGSLDRRSNHSGTTASDRDASRSNGGSSVNRRGTDGSDPLYSSVVPRRERSRASSSATGGAEGDDEAGSTRSGISSKSGKSSKSSKSGKHVHDVVL
ncbi:tetraspan membrane protein of hair cell stereocilia homolog [Acanthaster planci]|uniref:Tetraspan membrane protein of hair cell stereocilia homolog n=1 Tax=Acanthaster planci TaxID=133434 RepID=A0A8B7XJJ7_ACAPL|nr:tetraspan membrane protein of hair cell stereocilia homolog [Acanthaster planci]